MHWLQSLDSWLFHLVNGTLANRFFDWLMPLLSGQGVPWLAAAVIGAAAMLLFGSVRLRLCVLFMVLAVALGDPLVVGTIKDAIQRPRPFVTLPDARLFGDVGQGYVRPLADGSLPAAANVHSFPSAHAANWFAVATIAFFFYRRSGSFMFPIAAAVSFSRVYNGVHYPSDVTGGAILGTAYALAFLTLAQRFWQIVGSRLFPRWHGQLPNLLKANSFNESTNHAKKIPAKRSETEWLRLGYIVIAAALIGRWLYVASGVIGLSEDEAYQWLWSKHLALSYYSKPAGIALIQWTGTHLFNDTVFGVRFFSPVFAAILSLVWLRFIAREAGARAGFCLLLITFATPLLVAGSILMTVDPPLVLCWTWAVVTGWRAVQTQSTTRDWLMVGLALGLGFLCKYTAILQIICWAIYFLLQPSARVQLKKAGPWLALLVIGACALPVIIWNANHEWITLLHVAGDGGFLKSDGHPITLVEHLRKSLNYFLEFTAGEFGLLNPIFFLGSVVAMAIAWRRRAERPLWLYLLCLSAPLFLGHWLFSFHSRVQLNWIAAAVPLMLALMVLVWNEHPPERMKPWLATGVILGITFSVFMLDSDLIGRLAPRKLPGDADPSHRVRGWRETALLVEHERVKFDPNAFILADHYGTTGLYSFYSVPARQAAIAGYPLVYCIDSARPIDQFPFWDEYNYREHRHGGNALFVLRLDPYKLESGWIWKWLKGSPAGYGEIPPPARATRMELEFESVTNLGIREIKLKDGRVFQRVELFGCYHLK